MGGTAAWNKLSRRRQKSAASPPSAGRQGSSEAKKCHGTPRPEGLSSSGGGGDPRPPSPDARAGARGRGRTGEWEPATPGRRPRRRQLRSGGWSCALAGRCPGTFAAGNPPGSGSLWGLEPRLAGHAGPLPPPHCLDPPAHSRTRPAADGGGRRGGGPEQDGPGRPRGCWARGTHTHRRPAAAHRVAR